MNLGVIMGRTTLSHRSVSSGDFAKPPSPELSLERLSCDLSPDSLTLTRRQMLAFTGTVALGSSSTVNRTADALSPATVTEGGRAAFIRVGRRTLSVDATQFGGNPRVRVTRSSRATTVSVSSATYPGTDLPADFSLRIDSLQGNARVRIRTKLGGFDATVPLLAWLEGRASACCDIGLDGVSTDLGDDRSLRFAGTARAVLHSDLTYDLAGTNVATLTGSDMSVAANEVHLWLASSTTPTSLTNRIRRRTFIQLSRGDTEWQVTSLAGSAAGSVAFGSATFDLATIEAAQTGTGVRYAVVGFENSSGGGSAELRVGSMVVDAGAYSALPLDNVRFASLCSDGNRFSLFADIADTATWIHEPGCSVLVARHADYPRVELAGQGGTVTNASVSTELLGIAVPLEGVVSSPIMFPKALAIARGVAPKDVIHLPTVYVPSVVSLDAGPAAPPPGIYDASTVQLTRPDDMLTMALQFYNLRLSSTTAGTKLLRRDPDEDSYLVVELPPQALLEEAFYAEASSSVLSGLFGRIATIVTYPTAPPIRARLAGPTRLAFKIPDDILAEGIPYTLEGLLDWMDYDNSVAPGARDELPVSAGVPGRPPEVGSHTPLVAPETIIEAPWGLFLSPSETREYWEHRTAPFTANGVTELWHTNLTGRTVAYTIASDSAASSGEGDAVVAAPPPGTVIHYDPAVRVVWARGYGVETNPDLNFRNSFTTADIDDITGLRNRWALVDLTTKYQHDRVEARRLTLTPLGAWLDLKGAWPVVDYWNDGEFIETGVEAWEHRATMGRDQFVRVVKAGRIFPFGHAASYVTITERKYKPDPDGRRTAYLIQRSFIFMRELERTYEFGDTSRTRRTPFRKVTFKTRITPDLVDPFTTRVQAPLTGTEAQSAFWPYVLATSSQFVFEYVAEDWDGRKVNISSPLIWMAEEYASKVPLPTTPPDGSPIGPTPPSYMELANEISICRRALNEVEIAINGQKIAYCEPLPADAPKDRRVLETQTMRLGAENVVLSSTWPTAPYGTLHFHPQLHRAQVRLEDVEALMSAESGTWITLFPTYLESGFTGDNAGGCVFAELSDNGSVVTPSSSELKLEIPPDKAGGFATPNVVVTGLSATEGAFGGSPDNYGTGALDAVDFFANANPTLFGGITLLDVLSISDGVGVTMAPSDAPVFNDLTEERNGETWAIYEYTWVTKKFGSLSNIFLPRTSAPVTSLTLRTYLEKNLDRVDAEPSSGVSGTLSNFTLSLFDIIAVEFTSFSFAVINGGDVEVDPVIKDIRFTGALEFINQLREIMNFTGPDGGFALNIDGSGLSAIVTIALPDVAVGIFSLKNMAITAGFILPFTGDPLRFPFSFCTREKPFELAVSGFGGGGYFLVELQASDENQIALLELSLEFGVCASVSLAGIASGSVEIKGGVLIILQGTAQSFTAYFRMAGNLDILGIIVVSVTFNLSLTYMNKDAHDGVTSLLVGEATLTIDIEILFFSFSVELTVSKEFEGDDPRFGDWMEPDEWSTYCEAFGPAMVGV